MADTDRDKLQDDRSFWWACVDIKVLRDPNLSMAAKAVYAVLCTYSSTDGKRVCFPSIPLLAETSGCSERTVQRSLSELVDVGYVVRQERYKDNMQITSLYRIVGHRSENKPDGEQGGCQIDTGGVTVSHPELEPINPYLKDTATQDAPRPSETVKVPKAMSQTVRYLLFATGRTALLGEEVGAIMALEKEHYPSRVQTEIDTAVERFKRLGRPLSGLTFSYIFDSMKRQGATKFRRKQDTPKAREQPVEKTLEQLNYERWVAEKFGGGEGGIE